ncbi:MAG: hypothetical protein AAB316_02775 [Bacteroidota bacterium]
MKDLIILVADLDTENVLKGLLPRLEHVCGTRNFSFDLRRHINRDPGCLNESADFLRPFSNQYHHALVVFDKEGCGQESQAREELETKVADALASNGWQEEKVAAIVVDPEIENWMWLNSPHVSKALNWEESQSLYAWLVENGWRRENASKPDRPKEAMETVLKKTRKPRSASIYKSIAENVSFSKCEDQAFLKLLDKLKTWFG